ncbi:MAG: sulfatase-like hydrolase/transferase [Firmicutes bacterium]|nr:sulfatase-like hydrolase/transferase [Bacillota bacterium]
MINAIGQRKTIGYLILPLYLIYGEIVFKLMTVKECPPIAWVPTVLFPGIIGLIVSMLTGMTKSRKANRITRGVIMSIFALLFLVNFFIYKQFKIFYEPGTVFAGAAGVAKGFMDHVAKLIFSPSGLSAILLFIAPIVLYFIFGRKIDTGERTSFYNILQLVIIVVVASLINIPTVRGNEILKGAYSDRYSFQTAVTDFGLLTGIRLDATRSMLRKFGINSTSIAKSEEIILSPEEYEKNIAREGSTVDVALEEAAANIVYEKSVLDIDFAKLAEETSDKNLATLDEYVAGLTPSSQNEYTGIFSGKNLIIVTAEAFSDSIVSPELTPTLYRLMTKGINFTDYIQQATAGTIGGEYQIIFGLYPSDAGESFIRMSNNTTWFTMGSMLTREGYSGRAFHNGEYTYYDRDKTHNAIGYADEYMAFGNGLEEFLTDSWPRSDKEMFDATLEMYIDKQPFSLYYMSVSGHSLYSKTANAMSAKNWEYVKDMDASDTIKAYYAANLELEFALESMIETLEEKGIANDTVIVLAADHFPYGLDEDGAFGNMPYLAELYGFSPSNYMERDKNGLIIWCGELEEWDTITVDAPVSSFDILPTLLNLFGLEWDSRLFPGRDVLSDAEPIVFNGMYDWKTDRGIYIASKAEFTPAKGATIPHGYVDRINSIVREKLNYCWSVLHYDYYRHVIEDSGYIYE